MFEADWHSCLARPYCDAARGVCAVVIMDMMAEDYILVKLIITIRIIIYIELIETFYANLCRRLIMANARQCPPKK